MARRLLHVLSQRPLRTGSGVTLDALVTRAAAAGWDQRVVCAEPSGEPVASVGGLAAERISALAFDTPALPFAIPGMSDVMPYPSRRFSSLTADERARYLAAWRDHLARAVDRHRPDVIHVHHVWLVAAMMRDVAPQAWIVDHCHGTGLRQLELCPQLADQVRAGCARNDRFLALHGGHRAELTAALGVAPERVAVVGAGYRDDVFAPAGGAEPADPAAIVFAGKLSHAKGLPWLVDAVEALARRRPVTLHVAGGGSGDEADALRQRLDACPSVVLHGMLSQQQLAALLRRSTVFALPSMFEGLPLALIEAAACGCRAVATALPGVTAMASDLGDLLLTVPPPRRTGVDRPIADDLPGFTAALEAALDTALDAGRADPAAVVDRLRPYSWDAVYERVERIWNAAPRG